MIRHEPVLLKECIEALNINPDGVYVDVTYGGGGHSKEILKRLRKGKLVAFDQDADAVSEVEQSEKLILIHQNFKYLKRYLQLYDLIPIDGILADLGVSSHQIDLPERGFAHRFDSALDMRMDQSSKLTARYVLNEYPEEDLQEIFREYGEVENWRRLVRVIIDARAKQGIETVAQLKDIIEHLSKGNANKYLSKIFQALRIEVNKELEALAALLTQCSDVLRVGGRLVVISYHSLEDRMVKNFIKAGNVKGELLKDVYGNHPEYYRSLIKKPITASAEEVKRNSRARSAKMRVAERI